MDGDISLDLKGPGARAAGSTSSHDNALQGRCAGRTPRSYHGSLDGLRALAVLSVLLYHAEVGWLPGGFLGVEVFFVLSGYLITTLLLTEAKQKQGDIDLSAFWLRRCRRLLPALMLVVFTILGYAAILLPAEIAALRIDALAALTYLSNWYLIIKSVSYFEAIGRPSLLQHCWSLAVEGQFYLIWPFVVAVCARHSARVSLLLITLGGLLLSAGLMISWYDSAIDPSRLYYGSDTRAAGLLAGALTAQLLPLRRSRRSRGGILQGCISLTGVLTCVGLFWLMCVLDEHNGHTFQGGMTVTAIFAALLIAVLVRQQGGWTTLFSNAPMRWLGARSYGIYLWHWPVYCITRPDVDVVLDGPALLLLRIAVTLVLAALSFRWLETPVRLYGLRWLIAGTHTAQPIEVHAPVRVASLVAAFTVVTSIGLTVATATPPPLPEELTVLEDNARSLQNAGSLMNQAIDFPVIVTPLVEPGQTSRSPLIVARPGPLGFSPACCVPIVAEEGAISRGTRQEMSATGGDNGTVLPYRTVLLFGDSVMLGAAAELAALLGSGAHIDAQVGRQVDKGLEALRKHASAASLGEAVVIHLGTNGTFTFEQMTEIMDLVGSDRHVFLLTAKVPRRWEASVNETIRRAAATWNNVSIIDWQAESRKASGIFGDDGVHLKPKGRKVYASLVFDGIVHAH